MKRIANAGTNMVVVSHLWRPLINTADRVIVIAAGKVILSGSPDEIRPQLEIM